MESSSDERSYSLQESDPEEPSNLHQMGTQVEINIFVLNHWDLSTVCYSNQQHMSWYIQLVFAETVKIKLTTHAGGADPTDAISNNRLLSDPVLFVANKTPSHIYLMLTTRLWGYGMGLIVIGTG